MNLLTEPVSKPSRPTENPRSPKEWLDALSSGECDQDRFFKGVSGSLQGASEAGWDLLALVDQYYRRGKINADDFRAVKTHLHGLLMGKVGGDDSSSPVPSMQEETMGAVDLGFDPSIESVPAIGEPRHETQLVATPSVATVARAGAAVPSAAVASAAVPLAALPSAAVPSAVVPSAAVSAGPVPAVDGPRRAAAAVPVMDSSRRGTTGHAAEPAAPRVSAPMAKPEELGAQPRNAAEAPTAEPTARAAPRTLAVGDQLRGRYRVQGILGQGGMGTVFAAVDQYRLDRSNGEQRVAIKVLHTEVIKRPRLFAELRREFQHLQALTHPNIVRVHEFDRDGDLAFFTMEYLSGSLLSRVLSAQTTSELHRPYALAIIRDAGAAVAHAHARGVVHGDLNLGNIFITDEGEVRVLDFGASHQLHRGPWISEFDQKQQIAVATPRFASPQLLEGETADARDDVYALACIAYVLLAGDHPFLDNNALKARTLRLSPSRPRGLSGRQWKTLKEGLIFNRERRPSDVREWLDQLDLRGAIAHLPPLTALLSARQRRRGGMRWAAIAAAISVLGACGWWVANHTDSIAGAGASVKDRVGSMIDPTMVSRWWDTHFGSARKAEPVILVPDAASPDSSTAPETAQSPASAGTPPAANLSPATVASTPDRQPSTPAPTGAGAASAAARTTPSPAAASTATNTRAPPTSSMTAAGAVGATPINVPAKDLSAGAPAATGAGLRPRIELTADSVDADPASGEAHVSVHRGRTLRGDASFSWWTESGTAKPGRDFLPVKSHVELIENGKGSADLVIPIAKDTTRHEARSFYVVIDQASDDTAVGPRTLTMVTLPGTD